MYYSSRILIKTYMSLLLMMLIRETTTLSKGPPCCNTTTTHSSSIFSVDFCCTHLSELIPLFPEISGLLSDIVAQEHPGQPLMVGHLTNTQPLDRPVTPDNQVSNPLMELTTVQTFLMNRMRFQTHDRSGALELSSTPGTAKDSKHTVKTPS